MSKKLAILSSYDVICGNAAFSERLIKSINESNSGWKAFPVDLNLNLNQNIGKLEVKAADRNFEEIASKLREFDAVNIQFEAGLYGILPSHVKRRLKKVLTANPKTFITYHSPRTTTNFKPRKDAIRFALRGRLIKAVASELDYFRLNFDVRMNRQIIKLLKSNDIPVVVHTTRSKDLLSFVFGLKDVHAHPIIFAEKTNINYEKSKSILNNLGLPSNRKLVGLFGFISKYKGHMEALDALERLPSEYMFVIAGRIHPQSLGNPDASKYVQKLMKKISTKPGLSDRVKFVGELNDEQFQDLVAAVDCCLLPYHEVGQDGSGIASLCFEVGKRVVASNSYAFDELVRLVPGYKTYRFDIENYIEMATQIELAVNSNTSLPGTKQFTLESQSKLYLSLSE
ncbi:glycosyltransferase [Rhodoluna lacicola]|uniref:glycosyltransferase n=1 Tax=Rhodoluna lacicola TaxID=529884 RepID=UPI002231C078|nr:glycosyltransferase [Rhodoluna lacicola]BDS49757.1 hypothetical protein RKACHI23_00190 [Rhodoluna lacicola]